MGKCECGRLKGNPCGPLRPNTINVTMPNTGTATGTTPDGTKVEDKDSSNHVGGVDESVEDKAPNSGDGNFDGVPDRDQPHVASLPSSISGAYLTVAIGSPSCTIALADNVNQGTLEPDPAIGAYLQGLLELHLLLGPGCSSPVTVTVYYHGESDLGQAQYRKYGPTPDDPTPHWYTLPGATFETVTAGGATVATVTFELFDGGFGDIPGAPDGVIWDPGGPGLPPAVTDIPTLSEVGILALAMLLLAAGVFLLKQKRNPAL